MKKIFQCFLTPVNWEHKAGDGLKTRKKAVKMIHPALQAQPGGTQLTLLLEIYEKRKSKQTENLNRFWRNQFW